MGKDRSKKVLVSGAPEASDEFNAYIGPVYRLLVSGASDKEIAQYLVGVETASLGFEDSDWRALVPVARKLRKVFTHLGSVPPEQPG